MKHAADGSYDVFFGLVANGIVDNTRRRSGIVRQGHDRLVAFGVHKHLRLGVLRFQGFDFLREHGVVYGATARIQNETLLRKHFRDIPSQVTIGDERDGMFRQRGHDRKRIRRRHAHVGKRFDARRGVDVAHHRKIIVGFAKTLDKPVFNHMGHRAIGFGSGKQNRLLRAEQLRALPHETHAAKHQRIAIELCRHFGKTERIAHVIGRILHFRRCVVMRENNRVPLLLELSYLRCERLLVHVASFHAPLHRGHMPLSAHLRLRDPSGHAVFTLSSIDLHFAFVYLTRQMTRQAFLTKAHRRNGECSLTQAGRIPL